MRALPASVQQLPGEFFDHGICQHVARHAIELFAGLVGGDARAQRDVENLALADVRNIEAKAVQSSLDGFALRIKNRVFWRNEHFCFHDGFAARADSSSSSTTCITRWRPP